MYAVGTHGNTLVPTATSLAVKSGLARSTSKTAIERD